MQLSKIDPEAFRGLEDTLQVGFFLNFCQRVREKVFKTNERGVSDGNIDANDLLRDYCPYLCDSGFRTINASGLEMAALK